MKGLISLIFILLISLYSIAQQTINATITHDGLTREYILYVPANYSTNTTTPLVLNFHGYTSNASDQMWYGDFRPISDTAGFIIAHPMGTKDNQGTTFWNVGWSIETVDDVGFISALIDSISSDYNIDQNRVYSTGMSNGGFMSYLLACQLSNKIAAIASVTGSMNPGTLFSCQPQHPTPVMQIHGTADGVVPYNGANFSLHIDSAVKYWTDYNNCDQNPIVTSVPNNSLLDGSTVTHYAYSNGNNGVSVELFKVSMGGHTWPGSLFAGTGTNQDINASEEIWEFFSRYDINGLTRISEEPFKNNTPKIYPNPTNSILNIEFENRIINKYTITDLAGHVIISSFTNSNKHQIDLSSLTQGIYIININNKAFKFLKTM